MQNSVQFVKKLHLTKSSGECWVCVQERCALEALVLFATNVRWAVDMRVACI